MGKGDRRTRRGKIWRGSHGKTRPHGKHGVKGTRAPGMRTQPVPAAAPPVAPLDAVEKEQSPAPEEPAA